MLCLYELPGLKAMRGFQSIFVINEKPFANKINSCFAQIADLLKLFSSRLMQKRTAENRQPIAFSKD